MGVVPAPDDAEAVLAAVRLGWCMAEVRGRNRPDAPVSPGDSLPSRLGHALPLQSERSFEEARVAAQEVLIALALKLGVGRGADGSSYAEEVDRQAREIRSLRIGGEDASVAWDELTGLIYRFDAPIQDSLYVTSDTLVCGYQVGRALAECYWALDPGASDGRSPAAWEFLLGTGRTYEISSLLGRHAAYMHADTAAVIAGSLMVWRHVAADRRWRSDALSHLYRQVRIWHDLTV